MKFIQYAIVAIALAVELLEASPAPKFCGRKCNKRKVRKGDIKKAHAHQCGEIANLTDFAEKGSKFVGGFKDETSCKASTCGKYGGGCAAFGEKGFLCHNSRAELIESCAVQGVANS
jgi:hypothetical protein